MADLQTRAASPDVAKLPVPAWRKPPGSGGEPVTGVTASWPSLADSRPSNPASLMSPIQGLQFQEPAAAVPLNAGEMRGTGVDESLSGASESRLKRGNVVLGSYSSQVSLASPVTIDSATPLAIQHPATLPLDYTLRGSGNPGNLEYPWPYYNRADSFPANYTNRRNNMKEQGRGNHGWRSHNRNYMSGRGIGMPFQQQRVGPRNLPRHIPPFMGTNPGFINASALQNAAGGMYYIPVLPPPVPADLIQGPAFFVPPGPPVPIPVVDPTSVRDELAKQIEYYFSVENLCRDIYLRSNMDEQGFVPVSVIANFNRVRKWTSNLEWILESLHNSLVVEVQGDKMRTRHEWARWPLPLSHYDTAASLPSRHRESDKIATKMEQLSLEVEHRKVDSDRLDHTSSGMLANNLDLKQRLTMETSPFINTNTNIPSAYTEYSAFKIGISEVKKKDSNNIFTSNLELGLSTAEADAVESFSLAKTGCMSVDDSAFQPRMAVEKLCGSPASFAAKSFLPFNKEDACQLNEETESQLKSFCGEGEDPEVNDQDVERLFIMIKSKKANIGDHEVPVYTDMEWKTIPDELAAVINKGLCFCEQELAESGTKTLSSNKQNTTEMRACSNPVTSHPVASNSASNGSEVHGHSDYRTGFSGPGDGTINNSREALLPSEGVKLQGGLGTVIEITPSDIVGFLFTSSPDSQSGLDTIPSSSGSSRLKLGSSHGSGALPGSCSPVGFMLKSLLKFQYPKFSYLEDNALKLQKYNMFHKHCIAERKRLGIGCTEDMNTLFRFWSYFLQEYYNTSVYKEFHELAGEDAAAKHNYGLECLFSFYSSGLEKKFRQNLYEDFEKLTLESYQKGCLYGLEKYWAFHFYRKQRGGSPIKKHPELERLLNEEFSTSADFERAKERIGKDACFGVTINSKEIRLDIPTEELDASSSLTNHTPGTSIDSVASVTSIYVS